MSKGKIWEKKHFFSRSELFIAFGARSKFFPTVDGKRSAVLSKLRSTSLDESFDGLFFYTLTSQNHSGFWQKVFGRLHSCFSNFQRNILQVSFSMSRRIFWTKILYAKSNVSVHHHFRNLGRKRLWNYAYTSPQSCRNAFYASNGKFREKPFAEKNMHFSISAKDLRQCCHNCILVVRKNILRICLFLKIFVSILFGHWEQNCWPFVENYSLVL